MSARALHNVQSGCGHGLPVFGGSFAAADGAGAPITAARCDRLTSIKLTTGFGCLNEIGTSFTVPPISPIDNRWCLCPR
jgi:hypothetical protein